MEMNHLSKILGLKLIGLLIMLSSVLLIEIALSLLGEPVSYLYSNDPSLVPFVHDSLNFLFLAAVIFLIGYTFLILTFKQKMMEKEV